MSDQCNILISSAGRRVALLRAFKEALAHLGVSGNVLAADMSRLSSAFHIADDAFVVPRCTSTEFIPTLLRACRERTIRLVIPTIDTELPVLAAHRDEFR
ncbi:MAG: hypothetical protein O7I93_16120, partial [Gemmatimonadetes bacterium]|nr:hypothetical protein [Gemmatimonadota bacterium]